MLVVYEPTEQSAENTGLVKMHVLTNGGRAYIHIHPDGEGVQLSFTASWCRELATNRIHRLVSGLPPGKLDIYGIRKHGGEWHSQPPDTTGKVSLRDRRLNGIFTNLFYLATDMVSHIFETDTTEAHYTKFWLSRLSLSHPVLTNPPPSFRCLLNKPDDIPKTPLLETDCMYGTLLGIPSEWAQSRAVMSYLLYIPRIWAAFYGDLILKELSSAGRLRHTPNTLTDILECYQSVEDQDTPFIDVSILRFLARKLMIPLWFTQFGKEQFWVFTYILIREGIKAELGVEKDADLRTALNSDRSGFMSWVRWYAGNSKAPKWVAKLLVLLRASGPSAVVQYRSIAKNV